jgi:hypothetical protein
LSRAGLGFAASRVVGGPVVSLGLLLVVVAGAELFTDNNLLAIAWAPGAGGSVLVTLVYYVIYVRPASKRLNAMSRSKREIKCPERPALESAVPERANRAARLRRRCLK